MFHSTLLFVRFVPSTFVVNFKNRLFLAIAYYVKWAKMNEGSDRHKSKRVRQYLSGAKKRKRAQEKKDREETQLPRQISEFFSSTQSFDKSSATSEPSGEEPEETHTSDTSVSSAQEETESGVGEGSLSSASGTRNQPGDGFENDIGLWPSRLSAAAVEHWAKTGCSAINNMDGPFDESIQVERIAISEPKLTKSRFCSRNLFERTLQNGEKVPRTWLCCSLSTGRVYCFACKLLNGVGNLATIGYGDWKAFWAHFRGAREIPCALLKCHPACETGVHVGPCRSRNGKAGNRNADILVLYCNL